MISDKLLKPLEEYFSRPRDQYSVPLRIAPSYVDRSELSLKFEKKLLEGENESDRPSGLLIHGLDDTNKTQLALNHVKKHRNSYDPILWIDAKNPKAVRSSFVRCADELRLQVDSPHMTEANLADFQPIQKIIRWLEARKSKNKKFLVVFDNGDSFLPKLKKVVPQTGHGSVIIISQYNLTSELLVKYEELRVDIMKPLEARAVLLQRLKLKYNSTPPHVQKLCDNIAKMLEHLVLAVDLAGAYTREEVKLGTALETALMQYIEDFGAHQDYLLQQDDFCGSSETDKTVWTVWDKTLDRIRDRGRDWKCRPDLLLTFLSYFRGSIVQDELFGFASLGLPLLQHSFSKEVESLPPWLKAWTELKEDQWDDFCYRESRKVLARYGLIQWTNEHWPGLTIHRLVQWKASMYEKDQPWEVWLLIFFTAICKQSFKDLEKSQFRRHIIPHLSIGMISEIVVVNLGQAQMISVGDTIGRVYNLEGRFKEAEEMFRQSLTVSKSTLGEEHKCTLTSIANPPRHIRIKEAGMKPKAAGGSDENSEESVRRRGSNHDDHHE